MLQHHDLLATKQDIAHPKSEPGGLKKKSEIYPRQIQKDVEQLSLKTVLCFREMSMWIHCRVSEPPSFIDMAVAFCKWSDPSILSLKLEHTTAGIVLVDWW